MAPSEPTFTLTLSGSRVAVADCAYLALSATNTAWQKADIASRGLTRLTLQNDSARVGYIDFESAGGRTRVTAYLYSGLQGAGAWSPARRAVAACG